VRIWNIMQLNWFRVESKKEWSCFGGWREWVSIILSLKVVFLSEV
jgi:hypothetical protein